MLFRLCSLDRIHKSEKMISTLPASHQRRLEKYKIYLQKFKKCLDANNKIVHLIIKDVDTMFENVDHSMDTTTNGTESFGCNYNNCEISSQKQHKMQHDVEKVSYLINGYHQLSPHHQSLSVIINPYLFLLYSCVFFN